MPRDVLIGSIALLLAACHGGSQSHHGDGFVEGDGGHAHHGGDGGTGDGGGSNTGDGGGANTGDGGDPKMGDAGSANNGDAAVTLNVPFLTSAFDTWNLTFYTSNSNPTTKYASAIDQSTLYNGAPTLEITPSGATVNDCGYLYESPSSLAQFLGHRIRMTAAVKTMLDPESFAALNFYDIVNNTDQTLDDMSNRRITGTTGFTSYDLVLDISPKSTGIYFGIQVCGTGPVWLSPPVFEAVPDSVPVTATYTSP